MFCAFGAGSPHGICRGSSYFDYDDRFDEDVLVGEYDGAARHNVRREVAIPELVDEASVDGGDSLEVAVARMREFNGRRYDGVLDEDPARHVNAFWYGLKKLSQYCEAAVRVDVRAWDCFIDKVQFAYDEPWAVWLRRWTTNRLRLLSLPWMRSALTSKGLVWREVSP